MIKLSITEITMIKEAAFNEYLFSQYGKIATIANAEDAAKMAITELEKSQGDSEYISKIINWISKVKTRLGNDIVRFGDLITQSGVLERVPISEDQKIKIYEGIVSST